MSSDDVISSRDLGEHHAMGFQFTTAEQLHRSGFPQCQTNITRHNQQLIQQSCGDSLRATIPWVYNDTSWGGNEEYHADDEDNLSACKKCKNGQGYVKDSASVIVAEGSLQPPAIYCEDKEVTQWYFVSQMLSGDLELFQRAHEHWVKGLWEMALVSQPLNAAIKSYAMHKRAALCGSHTDLEYHMHKGRMIQEISTELSGLQGKPNPLTIVAIAILGYLELRDARFETAEMHLRAVGKVVDLSRFSNDAWLHCVWSDLRWALFTTKEPHLPFYIPAAYRQLPISVHYYQSEATRRGSLNALACPRSSHFTLAVARDMFCNLQALCRCSETVAMTDEPPFGQIYTLEYGLRVVQARIKISEGSPTISSAVLLITSTIQLHVWVASRFWTPQRRESHYALMAHACKIMASWDDLVVQWRVFGSLNSLLWILFITTTTLRAHARPLEPVLQLLYEVLKEEGIFCSEIMEMRLREWPWLEIWHPEQIKGVWELLCVDHPDLICRELRCEVKQKWYDSTTRQYRCFVGGLEFFNSQ